MFNIPTVIVAKTTLTSTASSVTLSYSAPSVSWTPRHLVVRVNGISSQNSEIKARFNGDSGTNYNRQMLRGQGTTPAALRVSGENGYLYGSLGTTLTTPSGGELLIPDALSTRSHKSLISLTGWQGEGEITAFAGRWANTAAITSVTILPSAGILGVGTTIELCVVDESYNINEQIKTAGTGTGTFAVSSIVADIGDLVVIGNLRSDIAQVGDEVFINLNSDDSSYPRQRLEGYGSTVGASASSLNDIGGSTAANATAGAFGAIVAQFPNYANGDNDEIISSFSGYHSSSSWSELRISTVRRNNVEAITAFTLDNQASGFIAGSMLSTYAVPKNLIERQELSGTASSVTFSSIPQTYDHLELSIYVRGDSSGQPEAGFRNEFNGDTTVANYKRQHLIAYGTTVGAGTNDNNTPVDFPTSTATANVFGSIAYSIQNYTKTDRHKHYMVTAGDAGENELRLTSNRWANTAAISSIVFTPSAGNFIAGSVFTLRGIHSTVAAATSDVAALNGIAPADIEAVN
jgi:hypothetical protein